MIGIITFHCQYNFGSAMQALAMQRICENLGETGKILNYYYVKDMKQYDIRWNSKSLKVIVFDLLTFYNSMKRKNAYHVFQKKYFNLSIKTKNWEKLKEISKDCDKLICGSDQIWNVKITEGIHPAYFLKFADKHQRLISYAPSVAISQIPGQYCKDMRNELLRFDAISVREEHTAIQLRDIVKKDIKCVLDPTLLFDAEVYNTLLEGYQLDFPKKYIFMYSLHHSNLKKLQMFAEKYAKDNNVEIVYFNKYDIHKYPYKYNIFVHDPRAFLYAIKNAEFVVSDSFHAGAFSILYKKQFATYALQDSKGRMDTIFSKLNIEGRFLDELNEVIGKINYQQVYENLSKLREESIDFLKNALEV